MLKIKFIIFSLLISLFFPPASLAKDYSWSDLRQECFFEKTEISISSQETLKVKSSQRDFLLFVQDDVLLVNKIFDYGKENFINYDIIDSIGLDEGASKYIAHLNDGNYATALYFDSYTKGEMSIIIDAKENLKANNFSFLLKFSGDYSIRYFISLDNVDYTEVKDIEEFDFRYLKVTFKTKDKNGVASNKLLLQELNLKKSGVYTYLLKPNSSSRIQVYSIYECNNEDVLYGVLRSVEAKTRETIFSTDINTTELSISLEKNPEYNNDFDNDGILNDNDNCKFTVNESQVDLDGDFIGDACDYDINDKNFYEVDSDGDQIGNQLDNCPYIYNPLQRDGDADRKGDLCADDDKDGVIGKIDNCPKVYNPKQEDININNVGDACEFDKDEDGVFDSIDNCIVKKNPDQLDQDNDGIGDMCDNCEFYNPQQKDNNNNEIGDKCEELEENKIKNDKDQDGILDYNDNCVDVFNPGQNDNDKDGSGDECDNCPNLQNSIQIDINKNGVGDVCEDVDGDGILGYLDNCMFNANADQADQDNDGVGDVCEDKDHDGIIAVNDNCPNIMNKNQLDIDKDGVGDKCDNKNDSFIESNKTMFYSFIVFITVIFLVLIFFMIKKINLSEDNVSEEAIDESTDANVDVDTDI